MPTENPQVIDPTLKRLIVDIDNLVTKWQKENRPPFACFLALLTMGVKFGVRGDMPIDTICTVVRSIHKDMTERIEQAKKTANEKSR
jgi:hypothetical protein